MKKIKFSDLYLFNNHMLKSFIAFPYPNFDIEEAIKKRKKFKINRDILCDYLLSYHSKLPYYEVTSKQIEKLKNPNTFTVCTGQQPGLYGGPLFTWYKAIYAISYANKLKQNYPDYDFIPIFFIASEDHDINEVKRTWITYHNYVEYSHFSPNEVIGRHKIKPFDNHGIPEWARSFWLPGERWSYAFSKLILSFLGKYGLVLFDPDYSKLKQEFSTIIKNDLNGFHYTLLEDQSIKLYKLTQIKPPLKPRRINLFYIDENNKRYGIIKKDFDYIAGPYKWNKEEIFQTLSKDPGRFSPSAALRPLFQEYCLPNLIYIGGWTEIHYWLQLKQLFEYENIFFPILLPRPSILLFNKELYTKWRNLSQLSPECILLHEDKITYLFFERYDSYKSITKYLDDYLKDLKTHMEALCEIDPLLEGYTNHIYKKNRYFSRNVLKKHIKHLKSKNDLIYKEIISIKRIIQPSNLIQERTLSALHFPHLESFIRGILSYPLEEGRMNIFVLD